MSCRSRRSLQRNHHRLQECRANTVRESIGGIDGSAFSLTLRSGIDEADQAIVDDDVVHRFGLA